jgi:hypothetical protein
MRRSDAGRIKASLWRVPWIRRCGVEEATVSLEDGRGEKRFLLDEGYSSEAGVLGIKAFFAREKGSLAVGEAEMELAVARGEDLELRAGAGMVDMNHDIIRLVPEEELAALGLGKIVVALHDVTVPYRE